MSGTHASSLNHLIVLIQDGRQLVFERDAQDRLRLVSSDALNSPEGGVILGFGPWPAWHVNVSNRVVTLPDEESGLFEPERLFVLREQYLFLSADTEKPSAFGPIEKAYWEGTESIVQARRKSGRH